MAEALNLFPGAAPADEPPPGALRLAEVAPDVPVPGSFTYLIPDAIAELTLGARVQVPFGGRRVEGFVVGLPASTEVPRRRLRPLTRVLDPRPLVTPEVLELARWAADYYHAALGEVLAAAIPRQIQQVKRTETWAEQTGAEPAQRLGDRQRALLDALAAGPRPLTQARAASGATPAVVRRLVELGLVRLEERAAGIEPPAGDAPPELTPGQRLALSPILRSLDTHEHATTLLFGITGSGKTEVYLRAIARTLEQGRGAIVLVPEIALTPQTLSRFRARFGGVVAVLHSQLSAASRRDEWQRVWEGEARVVVGPRSAVWAPVRELGLIVVDEEHETTYKQEHAPRYHARDLAVVRGKQAGVPVVLGSATPSLESYRNSQRGRYRIARLRERPGQAELPRVVIVDMSAEYAEVQGTPLLSRVLVRELEGALARGERALLFQNRRGFTTFLQCPSCGHLLKCRDCDVTLTYHRAQRATVCHFCDRREPPPDGSCPACLGPPLRQRGAGTERIEEIVGQLFPEVRVGRLDTDVVRGGSSPEEVLARFAQGELSILVGTQMIAKGLDVPELTVVGVVSADTSLSLPDFRASERTFQLVAQVAGRAGRGGRPGCTVVQTFLPEQFAIKAAADHAFERFAQAELQAREALAYPPYARLLKILVRGPQEREVEAEATGITDLLRRAAEGAGGAIQGVLGPAPSPRAYLTGKFRWQVLVKASAAGIRGALAVLAQHKGPASVERVLDVDPYHLL